MIWLSLSSLIAAVQIINFDLLQTVWFVFLVFIVFGQILLIILLIAIFLIAEL